MSTYATGGFTAEAAAVIRGFGLTASELDDVDGEGGTERLRRALAASPRGVESAREYWTTAPAFQLGSALGEFGYDLRLVAPDGGEVDPREPFEVVLEDGGASRRTQFSYPDRSPGTDDYPALVGAVESDLLPAELSFVRLADDGDRWRFLLARSGDLADLRDRFGERIELDGGPLLAERQPLDAYREAATRHSGSRPEEEAGGLAAGIDDAFRSVERAAATEPVAPTAEREEVDLTEVVPELDGDRPVVRDLRDDRLDDVVEDLAAGRDPGRPATDPPSGDPTTDAEPSGRATDAAGSGSLADRIAALERDRSGSGPGTSGGDAGDDGTEAGDDGADPAGDDAGGSPREERANSGGSPPDDRTDPDAGRGRLSDRVAATLAPEDDRGPRDGGDSRERSAVLARGSRGGSRAAPGDPPGGSGTDDPADPVTGDGPGDDDTVSGAATTPGGSGGSASPDLGSSRYPEWRLDVDGSDPDRPHSSADARTVAGTSAGEQADGTTTEDHPDGNRSSDRSTTDPAGDADGAEGSAVDRLSETVDRLL